MTGAQLSGVFSNKNSTWKIVSSTSYEFFLEKWNVLGKFVPNKFHAVYMIDL